MVENKRDNILNDNELLNSIQSIYIHINKRGHFNGNEETSSKNLMIIRSKRNLAKSAQTSKHESCALFQQYHLEMEIHCSNGCICFCE